MAVWETALRSLSPVSKLAIKLADRQFGNQRGLAYGSLEAAVKQREAVSQLPRTMAADQAGLRSLNEMKDNEFTFNQNRVDLFNL